MLETRLKKKFLPTKPRILKLSINILLCLSTLTTLATKSHSQDLHQWTINDDKFQVALKRIPTTKDLEGYVNLIKEIDEGRIVGSNESQKAQIIEEFSHMLGNFAALLSNKYKDKTSLLRHSDPSLALLIDLVIDFHAACQKRRIHFKNLTKLIDLKITYLLVDALKKSFLYGKIAETNETDQQANLIALTSADILRFVTNFNISTVLQHKELKTRIVAEIGILYKATKDEVARGYIQDFAIYHVKTFGYGSPETFTKNDQVILDAVAQYLNVVRAGSNACEILGFNAKPDWFKQLVIAKSGA